VLNGKDILALGWPAGKVVGLGLETARTLEERGLSREEVLAGLEEVRRDPGALWSASPKVPWPSSPASWCGWVRPRHRPPRTNCALSRCLTGYGARPA